MPHAPHPPNEAPRQIFADYFTGLQTRDVSGQSENWRYYHGDKVQWSGDLYVAPGADRKETATPFYPLIGPYDTLDSDVLEYHILLAKLSGLDGFLCEYATAKDHDGQATLRMAELANKYGFQVGIHWVPVNFTTHITADNRVDMLEAAKQTLRQVLQEVYGLAGARVNGRPLVLLFGVRAADYLPTVVRDTHFSASEVAALREAAREFQPLLLSPHFQAELVNSVDGFYPWVLPFGSPVPAGSPYDRIGDLAAQTNHLGHFYSHAQAALQDGRIGMFLGGVWPGFDDHRGRAWGEDLARCVPREEGRTLQRTWDLAVRSGAATILQVTWNDWVESTIIEPSRELGYTELGANQRRISEWKRIPLSPASLRWPLRLFQCRREIRWLERLGWSGRLGSWADQLAMALSQHPGEMVEANLASLESHVAEARSRMAKRDLHLSWPPETPDAGLELSAASSGSPRSLAFRPQADALPWRRGRGLTGRLRLTFFDDTLQFLRVLQIWPGEEGLELARFRKTGTQTWRTVELDIGPLFWDDTMEPGLEILLQASEENEDVRLKAAHLDLEIFNLEGGKE